MKNGVWPTKPTNRPSLFAGGVTVGKGEQKSRDNKTKGQADDRKTHRDKLLKGDQQRGPLIMDQRNKGQGDEGETG
jgi:hypothetical protein